MIKKRYYIVEIPADLDFKPNKHQIESAARRANDWHVAGRQKSGLVYAVVIAIGLGAAWIGLALWMSQ